MWRVRELPAKTSNRLLDASNRCSSEPSALVGHRKHCASEVARCPIEFQPGATSVAALRKALVPTVLARALPTWKIVLAVVR